MKSPLALGLVGAGAWGRNYIRSLDDFDEARLVHVVTRSSIPDGLPLDCKSSHDWRALLNTAEIDGLIIAAPAMIHEEIARLALQNGIPVLLEKPPALTAKGARQLLNIARQTKTILQINYIDLENPAWPVLLEHLPALGELQSAELEFGGPGPVRDDSSCLWDWGSHPLAMLIRLLGDELPAVRQALRYADESKLGEEIRIKMQAERIEISCVIANNREKKARRLRLLGREAELIYDDTVDEKLTLVSAGGRQVLSVPGKQPLRAAIERFCDSIKGGGFSDYDALLGLHVNTVLEEIDARLNH